MKPELKYVELKSGFSGNGNAWIGLVSFSKSGKTIYFNGKAFQSLNGTGISGNYFDLENGDEYWISGVKKDMSDRHEFGGGKIFVEKRILSDYLEIVRKTELPKTRYQLVEVDIEKPISRINELQNLELKTFSINKATDNKTPKELTTDELQFLIEELIEAEKNSKYNKGRRMIKKRRVELEMEFEKRK